MRKPGKRKLKVFAAQFGFHDTVVAAPSQAAALRAWGTGQDLFAAGQAGLTDDPEAIAAALAHPETPLRRAVGSTDAFALEAASLPAIPDAPKRTVSGPARAKTAPKPARPPPDRSALDAAEAALRQLDADRRLEEAELRRRQSELDAQKSDAQIAWVEARKVASAAVVEARGAYRKTGGRD